MRYGFKAYAKRLAEELRIEIELLIDEPFNPWTLAAEYGVDIVLLSELACSSRARQHFLVTRPAVFSGALIPGATGTTIVENDGHLLVRRRSTVWLCQPEVAPQ